MGFACVGFALIYLAVRYNSFYTLTNNVDTKGAAYALALQHLTIGIYIGEICLAGLFGINKSWPHLGLMLFFILVTAIWQITMNAALKPQQKYLPDDLSNQTSLFMTTDHKSYDF